MSRAKPLHSTSVNDVRYDEEESLWIGFVDARKRLEGRKFPAATDFLRWAKLFLADERTQRWCFDRAEVEVFFSLMQRVATRTEVNEHWSPLFDKLLRVLGVGRAEAHLSLPSRAKGAKT